MYPYILSPASATEHLRNFKYEYDRLNQLEKFTLSGGDTAGGVYTYDRLNRLYSAQIVSGVEAQTVHDQTYTYTMDEFGNVLAQNAPYPGDPALPKAMSVSLSPATNRLITSSYDLLGNQTLLDRPGDQPDLRLIYQGQGHIHLVKNPTTGEQFGYYYDTEGKRRIKAKMIPDPSNPTNYIPDLVNDVSFSFYEGEDLICQQDRGEFVVDYTLGQPSTDYYGTKFLLLDHLGTTRAELRLKTYPIQLLDVTDPDYGRRTRAAVFRDWRTWIYLFDLDFPSSNFER